MALARTLHATVASAANVTSVTTGSFTPDANSLLVVLVQGTRGDNAGTISAPTGGGLTYTQRAYGTFASNWDFGTAGANSAYTAIYTAPVGGSPSSMTVTGNFTLTAQAMSVTVLGYTGYDTSTPIGATDTGAEAKVSGVGPAGGAVSDTLSASPATSSEVVAGMALDNDTPSNDHIDTGSGWTQTAELQPGTFTNTHNQVRTGSTSSSYGWDGADTNYSRAWAAIEVKADATQVLAWITA